MASSLNTPDVLTQPIAENGDKNTIPSTNDQSLGQMSQSTGFPAICSERIADGGKAPRRADFNGAFNMLSRYIFFNQNGGVETFRADVSTAIGGYPKDAILGYKTATEFKLVRSLIANNTYNFNTTPSYIDDGSHWESVIPMSKNISNWSSNVSNCITEIPQDIKLELNNGTLTLKAGSKVYVPNGAGVFEAVTIASDLTYSSGNNDTRLVFLVNGANAIDALPVSLCYSGTSAPSGNQYMLWYDTTNNAVKYTNNSGSTWTSLQSLPIAKITCGSGSVTSIDQVYNGFGYIGSTVFALPGVKGLYPNGRNADGTLKSGAINITEVKTYTISSTNIKAIRIASGGLFGYQGYIVSDTKPSVNFNMWYNPVNNIMYDTGSGTPSVLDATCCASVEYDGTRITSFNPKTPFHAVDYSDFDTADQQNVKLTGDQTIAGAKTFSNPIRCGVIQNSVGKASAHFSTNATSSEAYLTATSPNNMYQTNLLLHVDNNGNRYAAARASDATNSIVTTTGILRAQNGYVKLGNGIIIQWGTTGAISTQDLEIILPTAFSSSNYSVTATMNQSGGSNDCSCHTLTTTSFKLHYNQAGYSYHWIAIGY